MKTKLEKTKPIPRDFSKIPLPGSNPVAGLIEDTLEHFGLTQAEAARAMKVSPGLICDLIKDRRPLSTDTALRLERCLGLNADFLLKVQASHQYSLAYHSNRETIEREVVRLAPV